MLHVRMEWKTVSCQYDPLFVLIMHYDELVISGEAGRNQTSVLVTAAEYSY